MTELVKIAIQDWSKNENGKAWRFTFLGAGLVR
jgi:hypothetical protein